MSKTIEERAIRDALIQRLLMEFVMDAPKVKPGWVMVSPASSKKIFMKILKMYPEAKGYGPVNNKETS
jgi:hypothetical protein